MTPKEEFIELLTQMGRNKGIDELSSRLVAILYIEPKEIALEDLAEKTGYSLSAVSTSMKFLENINLVKKTKKPKSRKIYFYMEKDMLKMFTDTLKKMYQLNITIGKQEIPQIIKNYKQKGNKEELKIIENYYKQLMTTDQIMQKMILLFEQEAKK